MSPYHACWVRWCCRTSRWASAAPHGAHPRRHRITTRTPLPALSLSCLSPSWTGPSPAPFRSASRGSVCGGSRRSTRSEDLGIAGSRRVKSWTPSSSYFLESFEDFFLERLVEILGIREVQPRVDDRDRVHQRSGKLDDTLSRGSVVREGLHSERDDVLAPEQERTVRCFGQMKLELRQHF